MMGNFLTLATPFMIGGAPVLIYVIHRQGLMMGQAFAVIVLGGVAAQVALAGFNLLAALVLAGQLPAGAWLGRAYLAFVLTYFAALGLFVVLAVRFDRLRPHLETLRRGRRSQDVGEITGLRQARDGAGRGLVARLAGILIALLSDFRASFVHLTGRGLRHLAAATGWAACYFLLYFAVGLGVLLALDIKGHLPSLFAWQVVASTIALFTPSPGGSGAAELGAMYAFGGMLSAAALPAFVVLWRILTFHLNLLLGAAATAWWANRLARQGGGASPGE